MRRMIYLAGVMGWMAGTALAEPIQANTPLEVNLRIYQGAVTLEFDTAADKYYQIEFSKDLVSWDAEGYAFKGTGGRMSKTASGRGLERAYYRLRNDGDPKNVATANPSRVWTEELSGRVYTNTLPYEAGVYVRAVLNFNSLRGRAVVQVRKDAKSAWMLVAGDHPDELADSVDLNATIPAGWQYQLSFDLNTTYTVQVWNELK